MNDNIFNKLWTKALEYEDLEKFVADLSPEVVKAIRGEAKRTEYLTKIWTVAHKPLRDMLEEAGLGPKAFATRFCIPYRTVQYWTSPTESIKRSCPDWARLLFSKEFGML